MSFLGIGFLLGLGGILLPVAIHFFGRRRKVIQPWGAMRFLVEAKPNWKRRSLKIQDWLVLLLRIGAVALLALAFARPAIKTPILREDGPELIVIVDRSLSTGLGAGGGAPLADEIHRETARLLELLPPETLLRLYVNGSGLQNLPPATSKSFNDPANRAAWLQALKDEPPSANTLDWAAALARVAPRPNSHVVILADAAQNGWSPLSDDAWTKFPGAGVMIVPIGREHPDRQLPNLCVEKLEADQWRVQSGKSLTLRGTITNHGTTASAPAKARWTGGTEIQIPALAPGESHEVRLKRNFPGTGPAVVTLEIPDFRDALAADNQATKIIEVIDHIPVAVFVDPPSTSNDLTDRRFAQWAFAAAAGDPQSIATGSENEPAEEKPFYQLNWLTSDKLATTNLDPFPVVVWSVGEVSRLSAQTVTEKLEPFVQKGGGLWFCLPIKTEPEGFNHLFFPHEYGLSPAGLSFPRREPATIGLRPPTGDAVPPAFASLTDLQVTRYLNLASPLPAETRVLLEFAGGRPFAVSRQQGTGGVVVLTTLDADPGSGNLAASVGYVPLVRETLWQLASARYPKRNLTPGEIGTERWSPGLQPGENPVTLENFPGESNTAAISTEYLDQVARTPKIKWIEPNQRSAMDRFLEPFLSKSLQPAAQKDYETREIGAWLLVGLVGFLIMEVLLAHHLLSRRRVILGKG